MARVKALISSHIPADHLHVNLSCWLVDHANLTDFRNSGDVPLDEAKMREVEKAVRDAGIALEEGEGEGEGLITGWEGGTVWLVPTDEPLEAWKPIATRTL